MLCYAEIDLTGFAMPRKNTDTPFRYDGFPSPNGTVVPDDVFDVLAPLLTDSLLEKVASVGDRPHVSHVTQGNHINPIR